MVIGEREIDHGLIILIMGAIVDNTFSRDIGSPSKDDTVRSGRLQVGTSYQLGSMQAVGDWAACEPEDENQTKPAKTSHFLAREPCCRAQCRLSIRYITAVRAKNRPTFRLPTPQECENVAAYKTYSCAREMEK